VANSGQFVKGQKKIGGKVKGSKNVKTAQWEELAESITGEQADLFSNYMAELWEGGKDSKREAAELYLKTVEYFKPKQARVETIQENEIVIKVKHE
jgi:hypothetical protein